VARSQPTSGVAHACGLRSAGPRVVVTGSTTHGSSPASSGPAAKDGAHTVPIRSSSSRRSSLTIARWRWRRRRQSGQRPQCGLQRWGCGCCRIRPALAPSTLTHEALDHAGDFETWSRYVTTDVFVLNYGGQHPRCRAGSGGGCLRDGADAARIRRRHSPGRHCDHHRGRPVHERLRGSGVRATSRRARLPPRSAWSRSSTTTSTAPRRRSYAAMNGVHGDSFTSRDERTGSG
jgi:hypothetical protein